MIPLLEPTDPFPPLERALRRPNGLLAAGRDLSVATLVEAYTQGIFPWFSDGEPILWWSPDPRMVLFPAELHVPKSLQRRMKKDDYRVSADTAFDRVIRECAAPRPDHPGTWITRRMIAAYGRLERVLAWHGLPRSPAEAPLEYLARVLTELSVGARAASRLTDLFERAKFSQHAVGAEMKDEAIDALETVREDLVAARERAEREREAALEAGRRAAAG